MLQDGHIRYLIEYVLDHAPASMHKSVEAIFRPVKRGICRRPERVIALWVDCELVLLSAHLHSSPLWTRWRNWRRERLFYARGCSLVTNTCGIGLSLSEPSGCTPALLPNCYGTLHCRPEIWAACSMKALCRTLSSWADGARYFSQAC